jgi:hypothetical protein
MASKRYKGYGSGKQRAEKAKGLTPWIPSD